MKHRKRTAALAAAVLIGAALLSAEARNVVGYVKIEIPSGFSLVSVPFEKVGGGEWTLGEVFANAPQGTQVVFFVPGSGYLTYSKVDETTWEDDEGNPGNEVSLSRGTGFWVRNVGSSAFDLVLHGEVQRASFVQQLVPGLQLVAYGFPSAASLNSSGPGQPTTGDQVYEKVPAGYVVYTFIEGSGWEDDEGNPSPMDFTPGRAYWYRAQANLQWQQIPNFSF